MSISSVFLRVGNLGVKCSAVQGGVVVLVICALGFPAFFRYIPTREAHPDFEFPPLESDVGSGVW